MQRLADRDFKQEATLAQVMRSDAYQRHFWAHAGSEQIADYATASAHLAPRHAEARSAYMHLSDVLRNDYGINIEQMNRDHPTSLMDRHHALRDALDNYYASHRTGVEADQAPGHQATPTENDPDRLPNEEATAATGTEAAQEPIAADRNAETDQDPQASSADVTQARAEAAQARKDEADALAQAQQYKGEAHKDAAHTHAEEATGGRQPHSYSRASDADLAAVGERNPQAASVRERTRQNFPQSPKQRIFSTDGPAARKATSGRTTQARDLEATR